MMRITFIICVLFTVLTCSAQVKHNHVVPKKPNIILFLVDDMGWQDTSLPFYKEVTENNKRYHTPNMELLAKMGVKFTNAYANCVCTASRVSLLSGMNAARTRVTNWTQFYMDQPTDLTYPGLKLPDWNYNGLSPKPGIEHTVYVTPFPQLLHDKGYYTIHVGKAHFASNPGPGSNPLNLGYDKNIAGGAIGHPGSYLGTENFGNKAKGEYTPPKGTPGLEKYHGQDIFLTEALTLEAKKAMDTALFSRKPFFLYLAHYAVHTPYAPDKRFYQHYIDKGVPPVEAQYAALLEGMDKSLGDVLTYVKNKGIANNTIVIFMSDNGGLALTPPREGELFAQNLPLKSGKGSTYEGGIREPMIVYWPGVTKAGSVCRQYLDIEDFYPSILQMAGINTYKTVQHVDGVSFVPYLKKPHSLDTSRVLIWHFPNNWEQGAKTVKLPLYKNIQEENQGMGPSSAIRKGNWKLIYFYGIHKTELYNLETDISEANNLATDKPLIVKELMSLLMANLKKEDAQFPLDAVSGKPIYPHE